MPGHPGASHVSVAFHATRDQRVVRGQGRPLVTRGTRVLERLRGVQKGPRLLDVFRGCQHLPAGPVYDCRQRLRGLVQRGPVAGDDGAEENLGQLQLFPHHLPGLRRLRQGRLRGDAEPQGHGQEREGLLESRHRGTLLEAWSGSLFRGTAAGHAREG